MENLQKLKTLIFMNKKGSYISFPINQKTLCFNKDKGVQIDEEKIRLGLEKININPKDYDNNKYVEIKNGQILINNETKELFYCIGGGQERNLEIKPLFSTIKFWYNQNNMKNKSEQYYWNANTNPDKYSFCQVDELGNIYNKKNISEYFKK